MPSGFMKEHGSADVRRTVYKRNQGLALSKGAGPAPINVKGITRIMDNPVIRRKPVASWRPRLAKIEMTQERRVLSECIMVALSKKRHADFRSFYSEVSKLLKGRGKDLPHSQQISVGAVSQNVLYLYKLGLLKK